MTHEDSHENQEEKQFLNFSWPPQPLFKTKSLLVLPMGKKMHSSKVLMWGCSSLIACVLRKCMAIGVISLVCITLDGKVQNWYLFQLEEPWWLTQNAFPQVQLGWLKSRKALFDVCDHEKGFTLGVPCTTCRHFLRSSPSVEWLLSSLPPSLPPSIPTLPLCLCLSLFLSLLPSPSPGPYFVSVYVCVGGGGGVLHRKGLLSLCLFSFATFLHFLSLTCPLPLSGGTI